MDEKVFDSGSGCSFSGILNENNGFNQKFEFKFSLSIISKKVPVISTAAQASQAVPSDSLMDVAVYTKEGPLFWSHTQQQNGNNISRYIFSSVETGINPATDEIPITIVFSTTTRQKVTLSLILEFQDLSINISSKKTSTLNIGSPIVYKFNNEGVARKSLRVHVTRNDIEILRDQTSLGEEACTGFSQNCFCSLVSIQTLGGHIYQLENSIIAHHSFQNMVGRSVIDVFVGDEGYFSEGFVIVILKRENDAGCMSHKNTDIFARFNGNNDGTTDGIGSQEIMNRISGINITAAEPTFEFSIEITINDPGIVEHIGKVLGVNFVIYFVLIFLSLCCGLPVTGKVSIPNEHNPFSMFLKFIPKPDNDHSDAEKLVHENLREVDGTNSKGFYIELADTSDEESTSNDTEKSNDRTSTIRRVLNVGKKKSVRIITICNKQDIKEKRRDKDAKLKDFATLCEPSMFAEALYLKTDMYYWLTILCVIFYFVPSSQFVLSFTVYQLVTGNLDTCYYNYLCRYTTPVSGMAKGYGRVLSNIGYIFGGVSFIVIVFIRKYRRRNAMIEMYSKQKYQKENIDKKKLNETKKIFSDRNVEFVNKCGIPEQYGIYFALGATASFEGVFSACYHICPMNVTFQFDTTCMYILLILVFLKVYQFRHPDITANAQGTFLILGIILLLEAIGGYVPPPIHVVIFVCTCSSIFLGLGFHLFSQKRVSVGRGIFFTVMITTNLILQVYMVYYTFAHAVHGGAVHGVSNYLLLIFGFNTLGYVAYYIIMKCYFVIKLKNPTESLTFTCLIYLFLAAVTWFIAIYFFINFNEKDTTMSGAESRHLNSECTIWFFDKHDLWHFFSSWAIFFSCMALLTLEDNNVSTPWSEIPVF